MFQPRQSVCLLVALLLSSPQLAQADTDDVLILRLVPIAQGIQVSAFGDEPDRFRRSAVYKAAQGCGVDLTAPDHPLVVCSCDGRRIFYLFYNLVTNVPGLESKSAPPYLIQRIRRTVTDFPKQGEPLIRTDYLVEAMKTKNGAMKRPDQHFGSYGLRTFQKRRIVKEFEVGVGEVDGLANAGSWPFDASHLYREIQGYQADAAAFDECRFTQSRKWTLIVEMDRQGNYSLSCPEIGLEISRQVPADFVTLDRPPKSTKVSNDPEMPGEGGVHTKDLVINEGRGVLDLVVGVSDLADVEKTLGEPLNTKRVSATASNHSFSNGLTFNVYQDGPINTIFTGPGFRGRTSRGIRHGDTREKVNRVYGKSRSAPDQPTQSYDGVLFWFSGEHQVAKIVVFD